MSFVLLQVYLYLNYIRPQDWVHKVLHWPLMDITMAGILGAIVLEMLAVKHRLARVPQNRLMLLLMLALLMSHAVHTYVAGAMVAFNTFVKILVLYFVIINAVTNEYRLKITLWTLTVLTFFLARQGLEQHATGMGWAQNPLSLEGRIDWIGIFRDPNDLALAFVIVIPILLGYVFKRNFFPIKIIPIAISIPIFHALYLTNSRGGMLAAMTAVYYFFLRRWPKYFHFGAVAGGTLAGLLFLFGPSRLGMLSGEEASAYGRIDSWYYGFQLLKANPLFGAGYNMFTDAHHLTAHNSFVLVAAELGLFGLLCWVGLFYVSIKGLWRVRKYVPELGGYTTGLEAAMVGFAAGAFFLSRAYITPMYILIGLAASLFAIARRRDPENVDFRLQFIDWRNIGLLSLASLILVQIAMKTWL